MVQYECYNNDITVVISWPKVLNKYTTWVEQYFKKLVIIWTYPKMNLMFENGTWSKTKLNWCSSHIQSVSKYQALVSSIYAKQFNPWYAFQISIVYRYDSLSLIRSWLRWRFTFPLWIIDRLLSYTHFKMITLSAVLWYSYASLGWQCTLKKITEHVDLINFSLYILTA